MFILNPVASPNGPQPEASQEAPMNLAEFAAAPSSEKVAFLVRAIRAGLDRLNDEYLDAPDRVAGFDPMRAVFYGVKDLERAYTANLETLIELSEFAFEIEHLAEISRLCIELQDLTAEELMEWKKTMNAAVHEQCS